MRSKTIRWAVALDQGRKRFYLTPRKQTGEGHKKRAGWTTDLGAAAVFKEKRFASQAGGRTGESGWVFAEITENRKDNK